jgi:hypothetical protein
MATRYEGPTPHRLLHFVDEGRTIVDPEGGSIPFEIIYEPTPVGVRDIKTAGENDEWTAYA